MTHSKNTQPAVIIYSKGYCPYCHRAKALLSQKGVEFVEYDITNNAKKAREMVQLSGRNTVPQIFINQQHLGGSDDLQAAARSGLLDKLLNSQVAA